MTDTNVATITAPPIVVLRDRLIERKAEIKNALVDINPDHFIRAVTTSAQINPELTACSFNSIWIACMKACRDNLLPDGIEGVIVAFKSTATWIPMYRGLLKKFQHSGQCKWITAELVREGEVFHRYVDEHGVHFRHIPGDDLDDEQPSKVVRVYAAALTKDGGFYVTVLSMSEINKIRGESRASREDAPWQKWPGEMMKKTALRRLAKLLPMTRDIFPDDDDIVTLPVGTSPSLQPAQAPAIEPRRPQSAAASLDQFAGSQSAPPNIPDKPMAVQGDGGAADPETIPPNDPNGNEQPAAADKVPDADTPHYLIDAAHERGKQARIDGLHRKALPPEYRDAGRQREALAWQAGFDGKAVPTWAS